MTGLHRLGILVGDFYGRSALSGFRRYRRVLLLFVGVTFLPWLPVEVEAQSLFTSARIGKIVRVEETVVLRRRFEMIPVEEKGLDLYRGDEIITDPQGRARMWLAGGNEVFVAPSSILDLTKIMLDRRQFAYALELEGKVRAKVQTSKGRTFRVKTANALLEVKGTDFVMSYEQGETSVGTLSGLVELTSLVTQTRMEIPPGKMTSVTDAGELTEPDEIKVALVRGLEHAGKTGIVEIDRQLLPESDEASPVPSEDQVIEESVDEMDSGPAAIRLTHPWGFGLAVETGSYSGTAVFASYNLGDRLQLRLQRLTGRYNGSDGGDSAAVGSLERVLNGVSIRRFFKDSGGFFGVGGGQARFRQDFCLSGVGADIEATALYLSLEAGTQIYWQAPFAAVSFNIGSQWLHYLNVESTRAADRLGADDYALFGEQAMSPLVALMLGLGVYF